MGFLLSSREGRLCVDGKRVMTPYFEGMFPADQFTSGDLSLPATDINLKMVSQCYLDLFIKPMGMVLEKRPSGKRWLHSTLDIAQNYSSSLAVQAEDSTIRGKNADSDNSTRGWCLFAVNTLHRFFWKDFDCYRGTCKYDESHDYHWWLQNSTGDVIDLTEEQYRISKIDQLREEGKKLKPLGLRYAATSRAMAYKITELLSGQHYDPDVIDQYANAYMKR